MTQSIDIRVHPKDVANEEVWRKKVAKKLRIDTSRIWDIRLLKKSIDARGPSPLFQLRVEVALSEHKLEDNSIKVSYQSVGEAKEVIIIGAGPCGYFAALRCIELGLRPIVLDRGKDVRERRRDLRAIQQEHTVHPDSNYCFGEGGAGTYSDGKLYTRSIKRGNVKKVLQVLVHHGATSEILVDAHPHIGSNKLPKVVANMRQSIEEAGGEVRFGARVVDFIIEGDDFRGVTLADGVHISGAAYILCTGHSARDIYKLCDQRNVDIEFKPFAIGMRIEHPQPLIDKIQYNQSRGEHLPAAAYSLNCQVDDHGVFSFCMCPGGLIVPAATSPGELVVNGMSLSRRDSPYANAAMVVTLDENPQKGDPFGGMLYQQRLEQAIFHYGDGSQAAPSQRVTDFISGKVSQDVPESSYIPGTYSAPLHELLPNFVTSCIRQSLKVFDRKMKGYITEEAKFVGLESRTSAPIRIPRDRETLQSTSTRGLFPAGEGAGYAGGILSAALDGERVADAVLKFLNSK